MRQYRIKMSTNTFGWAAFSGNIPSSCVTNTSSNGTAITHDCKTIQISRTLILIQHAFETTPNNRQHWGNRPHIYYRSTRRYVKSTRVAYGIYHWRYGVCHGCYSICHLYCGMPLVLWYTSVLRRVVGVMAWNWCCRMSLLLRACHLCYGTYQ